MKYLNLPGEIGNDMLDSLIDFINTNQDEEMTIFFSSNGGYNNEGNSMIRVLNNHYQNITLVVGIEIYSFALDVLLNFKGLIVIANPVVTLIHKTSIKASTRLMAKKNTTEYVMNKQMEEENRVFITLMYKLLNKRQISIIEQNDDLILETKDLISVLQKNGNNLKVEL